MLREVVRRARLEISPSLIYLTSVIGLISTLVLSYLITRSLVISAVLGLLVFSSILLYPYAAMRSRKTGIDLALPHAIAYMQSLCGVMNVYSMIKQIFEERDIYKELSDEFSFVVRDVEVFGMSVIKALKNLAEETPSENLKEFLEGLILVMESGGNLKEYLGKKIEVIRERAKRQMEMNLRTLEIMSEVFVVLFVALPIFLAISLFTMQVLGANVVKMFRMYSYIVLPVGGMTVLYLVDVMNVKEELGVARGIRGVRYGVGEIKPSILERIKLNYYYSLMLSPLTVLACLLAIRFLRFKYFESYAILLLISALLPLCLAFEWRARYVRRIDKEIPEFLRQILNLREAGLTLQGVVRMIRESEIGVISRELRRVEASVELGSTLKDAFVEFVNRVGVSSIRRAISLLIRASEATENIRDVLITAIEDFEYGVRMRDLRFATGFSYAVIVYISFFIFLYTSHVLTCTFMAKLRVRNVIVDPLYRISVIVSVFSGLLAGEMEGGHLLYGLKHVFVFLISSLLTFEFFMG